jgi:hypothetical protein
LHPYSVALIVVQKKTLASRDRRERGYGDRPVAQRQAMGIDLAPKRHATGIDVAPRRHATGIDMAPTKVVQCIILFGTHFEG